MSVAYLCAQCGVQFAEADEPPSRCPICDDERQYPHPAGQTWMTLAELRATHTNLVRILEPGLTSIRTEPTFAMGHQALVVQSPHGNLLWDCVSLLDEPTIEAVRALGGITAIAISHPHFYDTVVEWSRTFGDVPVYLHAADRRWVMRDDPCLVFWDGEARVLNDDFTIVHCGGHFAGSAVLHWAGGAAGRGVMLTSDTIAPMLRPDSLTFMYSFPNMIPLSAPAVRKIVRAVAPFPFDRLYGIWFDRVIASNAKAAVQRAAERYLRAIGGESH
ncbi:MAG: MBL fold metallo-hydrolase [Planctomycetota bacterium]|jgi:hypothetical protein